jgi:hypothetical protein
MMTVRGQGGIEDLRRVVSVIWCMVIDVGQDAVPVDLVSSTEDNGFSEAIALTVV